MFSPKERKEIYKQALKNNKFPSADEEAYAGKGICSVLYNLGIVKVKFSTWLAFYPQCNDIFPELKLFKAND